MKEVTLCEVCGGEFEDDDDAEACEDSHDEAQSTSNTQRKP